MQPILPFALALILSASNVLLAQQKIPASATSAAETVKNSPRHGEWADIALPDGKTKIKTWVVYPERSDKAPVVIVIHEIFGLTDWVRAVADQLAADGFIAVAPDLLSGKGPGGGGTESFEGDKVREAIRSLPPAEVTERLNATRDHALKFPAANGKSATIGFCWGGSQSFMYATAQPDLSAAVVFYGTGPKDDAAIGKIKAPVLGLYGSDDARVNSTIPDTEATMKKHDKAFTHHMYDGAGHGFLRQQDGRDGANLKASEAAWKETIEFLRANTK
jgi:carboxymethylenebutenolidase